MKDLQGDVHSGSIRYSFIYDKVAADLMARSSSADNEK